MTKHPSFAIMIATTALMGLPVLAQTTTSTSSAGSTSPATPGTPDSGASGAASRAMTSPRRPAASGMASTTSPPGAARYTTADNQIRMSKLVGASVYNDQNQSVGSIDDVLLSDNEHKAGNAVVSVGGFLGMGSKLVSVPFDQLKIENDKIVIPGATKASLEGMPEYHYTNA